MQHSPLIGGSGLADVRDHVTSDQSGAVFRQLSDGWGLPLVGADRGWGWGERRVGERGVGERGGMEVGVGGVRVGWYGRMGGGVGGGGGVGW